MARPLGRRLRVAIWRHRFALTGLAVFVALRALLPLVVPAADDGPRVLVTRTALPAGHELTGLDLTSAALPAGASADGFLTETGGVDGRRLAVALPAGAPLATGMLADAGAVLGAPPGTVVAPVRFSDPSIASLLKAGHKIDVLAGSGGGEESFVPARTLASGALVLTTAAGQGGGLLPGEEGAVALLAVTKAEAAAISGAASWATLSAAWVE